MKDEAFRLALAAGAIGAFLAGVAALTWYFGLFAASFSLFGSQTGISPEPEHLFLMDVAAPALLGLATVPLTFIVGAGRIKVSAIALGVCATGAVASIQALDGASLDAGVGTFLAVAIAVPAFAVLAAWAGGNRDTNDTIALAGGLAVAGATIALLAYACSESYPLLTLLFGLCAWVVSPSVAGLVVSRRREKLGDGQAAKDEE